MHEEQEYHWFTSSCLYYRTDTSLFKCLKSQRKADLSSNHAPQGYNLYKVPGPSDSSYKISNFAPEVEGVEYIGYETHF